MCLRCEDVRGLDPSGQPVTCRCGNSQGYLEGERLHLRAIDREPVRVLGIHRQALRYADDPASELNGNIGWQMVHDQCVAASAGYIYHRNIRNCWMAIMRPYEDAAVVWDDEPPVQPSAPTPRRRRRSKSSAEASPVEVAQ